MQTALTRERQAVRVRELALAAHRTLFNGGDTLQYFRERGLAEEVVREAYIGFADGAFTYPCIAREGGLLAVHCKSKARDGREKRRQWWKDYADDLPPKGCGRSPDDPAKVVPFGMESLKNLRPGSLVGACCYRRLGRSESKTQAPADGLRRDGSRREPGAKQANKAKYSSLPRRSFRYFRLFRHPTSQERSHTMSGYLKLARRGRIRREESCHCPTSEAVAGIQPVRHNRAIHLGPEGRRLQSAGFEPKERGGKVIWERPDTGFWVS